MTSEYVQYGCGLSAPVRWRNFDASPTLRFERIPLIGKLYTKNDCRFPANVEYGDIVRGLPVADASCRAAYCSHILEHLALMDCRQALANTFKILRAGGCFRLVMPDLQHAIEAYTHDEAPDAAVKFFEETRLGKKERRRGVRGLVAEWLGNSGHIWMWDYKAIEQALGTVGFVRIRRARFGDAEDPLFADVETRERWDDCLGVECFKPE